MSSHNITLQEILIIMVTLITSYVSKNSIYMKSYLFQLSGNFKGADTSRPRMVARARASPHGILCKIDLSPGKKAAWNNRSQVNDVITVS